MRGARAKLLRKQAKIMSIGKPSRKQERFQLPPRFRWVDVPDDGKTLIERLRNKFLRALGLPTPTRRERREITPVVIREVRGTTRWVYQQLKRMYYQLRAA